VSLSLPAQVEPTIRDPREGLTEYRAAYTFDLPQQYAPWLVDVPLPEAAYGAVYRVTIVVRRIEPTEESP